MIKSVIKSIYGKLAWPMLPNGIYCFNYHRIGSQENSTFDPNLFSCTVEQFEKHIVFYNREFTVISVDELIKKMKLDEPIDKKYALITFDDGYIDNYTEAYPVLKKHDTPAAFYIPSDYIDSPHIPWWDEIAWIIRHSKATEIKLNNWDKIVDISQGSIVQKVRSILRVIKQDQSRTMQDKISELEGICQCSMPDDIRNKQLFVNWQQTKEMSDNGMHIGSHTLSHNILSHLNEEDQWKEISKSKERIESFIEKEVTSLAYPVGGPDAFTEKTQELVEKADYDLAFSFIAGVTRSFDEGRKYQLRRLPVDNNCTVNKLKHIIIRNKGCC